MIVLYTQGTFTKMDIKHSKMVTITLNENDIEQLRGELVAIDDFWDRIECEMKPEYAETILGELWRRL